MVADACNLNNHTKGEGGGGGANGVYSSEVPPDLKPILNVLKAVFFTVRISSLPCKCLKEVNQNGDP